MISFYNQLNQINVPKNDSEFSWKILSFFRSRNTYENAEKKIFSILVVFLLFSEQNEVGKWWEKFQTRKNLFPYIFLAFSQSERTKKLLRKKYFPFSFFSSLFPIRMRWEKDEKNSELIPYIFLAISRSERTKKMMRRKKHLKNNFLFVFSTFSQLEKGKKIDGKILPGIICNFKKNSNRIFHLFS